MLPPSQESAVAGHMLLQVRFGTEQFLPVWFYTEQFLLVWLGTLWFGCGSRGKRGLRRC